MKTSGIHSHVERLGNDEYYRQLIVLRDLVSLECDNFLRGQGGVKVDLYMISKTVSSPMGRGSDSKPVRVKFVNQKVHLVDSAQFGMEPIASRVFPLVYCYLPSFRGEVPDNHHLNQFYHCEAEIRGSMHQAIELASGLVQALLKSVVNNSSKFEMLIPDSRLQVLKIASEGSYSQVTFDEACQLLESDSPSHIKHRGYGRVITKSGEARLVDLVNSGTKPIWLTHFDSGTVPFYLKPDPANHKQVLNADLILPVIDHEVGGEVLGLGQRQDSSSEMIATMHSQGIKNVKDFEWYIRLRDKPGYQGTSGFGLGIERFISWVIGADDISKSSLYPISVSDPIGY